jgi:pantoate--beta-alanine ligase
MQIVRSVEEWKALRPQLSPSLGLIPTMGYLHDGHMSLVRRARAETECVVGWIFVNPKQFGANEDFTTYPRDEARDIQLLEEAGTDYLLAPGVEGVYPDGFQTYVDVEVLSLPLEGTSRPGHFRGVATVVAKMLCLTQPRFAYFGQKDAQQCAVVRRMVSDLGMLTNIVVCPTVREADGLAMSSRNAYLQPEDRKAAVVLYQALQAALAAFRRGERGGDALRAELRRVLDREPLAAVDYAEVVDPDTFARVDIAGERALAVLAVKVGRTRLIDNIVLEA